jgi:hypothetical protein
LSGFSDTPNIGAHRVSAEEQLTMPPQKKSKKNIPAETNQEDHHPFEGNEISFVHEPSNITDRERRAKSFVIACKGPVLNWYSLLPPHSVCSWVDLMTKFMQAFQMFHDTTTEASDMYNCKQKDREPLWNFVRRFMQQRSQISEADERTTINALIKGLTPGPTASHLIRKKPKTVEELFHELEEYILSDDDHRKRVAE